MEPTSFPSTSPIETRKSSAKSEGSSNATKVPVLTTENPTRLTFQDDSHRGSEEPSLGLISRVGSLFRSMTTQNFGLPFGFFQSRADLRTWGEDHLTDPALQPIPPGTITPFPYFPSVMPGYPEKCYKELINTHPEATYGIPQATYGIPQVTSGLPHPVSGIHQATFNSEASSGIPQSTYGLPRDNFGLPYRVPQPSFLRQPTLKYNST